MAHHICAIITTFPYTGSEVQVVLAGNFHLVLYKDSADFKGKSARIPPFRELTVQKRKFLRELSFSGKCAYIETHFFVEGVQYAGVWENGVCTAGPFVSYHGTGSNKEAGAFAEEVPGAVNAALSALGVYRHEGKDEFDSMRLGDFRSEGDVLEEFEKKRKGTIS